MPSEPLPETCWKLLEYLRVKAGPTYTVSIEKDEELTDPRFSGVPTKDLPPQLSDPDIRHALKGRGWIAYSRDPRHSVHNHVAITEAGLAALAEHRLHPSFWPIFTTLGLAALAIVVFEIGVRWPWPWNGLIDHPRSLALQLSLDSMIVCGALGMVWRWELWLGALVAVAVGVLQFL